jgi:hypothetical protein
MEVYWGEKLSDLHLHGLLHRLNELGMVVVFNLYLYLHSFTIQSNKGILDKAVTSLEECLYMHQLL